MYDYQTLNTLIQDGLCFAYIDMNNATISLDIDKSTWHGDDKDFHRIEFTQHVIKFSLGENLFNFLSLPDNVLEEIQERVRKNNGYWNGIHQQNEEQAYFASLECIYIYILYYSTCRYTLESPYRNSLINIKKEFEFALNFCCNEGFIPELQNLSALNRYYIYSELYNDNILTNAKKVERNGYIFLEPDIATDALNQMHRLDATNDLYRPIAGKEPITTKPTFSTKAVAELQKTNVSAILRYQYTNLYEYLMEELYALIQLNNHVKKCGRCGKFFITKGNYATDYCDRIVSGEKFSCKKIAAMQARKEKVNGNPILQEYQKAYKRLYARVSCNKMTSEDFRQWTNSAAQKRDFIMQSYGSTPPDEILADFKKFLGNR